MVKSGGAQRESDGVVVPQNAVSNAVSGKGPDFGHASGGGKRGGMAGTARSNCPGGREPVVLHRLAPVSAVRELQRKLWAAAKQSEGRRFHACMTGSTAVTCCGRRGSGCEPIVAPLGSIG